MNPFHYESLPRQLVRDLEKPIIYALMFTVSTVAVLVWGVSKIRGGRGGATAGLFSDLQPIFGTYYGIVLMAIVLAVLICNRRWIGVGIMIVSHLMQLMMYSLPLRVRPFSWDEYLALSPLIGLAIVTYCVYYDCWERASDD